MAYAPNNYTGNGSTVLFPFSFPYIDRAHVKVAVNGVLTTAFTFDNATTIKLNSAPAVGVPILIYRETPADQAEAVIFGGSAIRASDLNANTTQLLYVAEETDYGTEVANNTANAAAGAAANAVSTANAASGTASTALNTANSAVNTANAASSTANNALSTANAASSAASGAVSTANAANATAANALGAANQAADDADDALQVATAAVSTANTAAGNASTALSTANNALNTANTASNNATAAVGTANTANNTANTALNNANAAVNTANSASSAATAATNTANAASSAANTALSTANNAASTAGTALSTANTASSNASAAVSTANAASSTANNALSVANQAQLDATAAVLDADDARDAAVSALSVANAAVAAVASAVVYQPVVDLTALAGLTPADGDFFELQDSTGADTDPSITGVTPGLIGDPGLTFRLRYDDPPGEFVFLGYFANDPENQYAVKATEGVAASAQADADQALLDAAAAQGDATQALSDAAAAQATANAALPKAGGTMTGNISFAGTQTFPVGGIQNATIAQKGVVQLTDSVSSTSTTTAATPNAVKTANDQASSASTTATTALNTANGALQRSGGTMTGNITFAGGQTFPVGGIQNGTTAQKGVVQLTDSVSSTSTTTAATPNSVKSANDNANTRASKSGDTFTGDIIVPSINGGPLSGARNRIINGAMAVERRSNGPAQTFTAGAALAYSVDRWYGYSTGANVTGQRVQGASAGQFRYRFTGAASVTAIGFGQRIERLNSADLAGTTARLSVDLANSLLTSVTWTAFYANTDDAFGTLASPTRTQIATGTFTVTSTVTRYSTQISIPGAATTGIEIVFTVGAQTSGTWTIGDVQLEPGTVATPFERRSYGQELALCQRYFSEADGEYKYDGTLGGTNVSTGHMWYAPQTLRTTPTTTVRTESGTNCSNISSVTAKSSNGAFAVWEWTNGTSITSRSKSAIISFSAEL